MGKKEILNDTVRFDLPSGIPVEIQEVTGAAEKMLLDRKEMKTGKGLNRFILSSLVSYNNEPVMNDNNGMNLVLDMKSGDRNYLILRIRMNNYGEELDFNYKCPTCGKTSGYHINFQEALDNGELKVYPYRDDMPIVVNTRSGIAEIDYMTGRDEEWLALQKEVDLISIAVAGCSAFNGHKPTYKEFENLFVKDLNKIRLEILGLKGGLDPKIELECSNPDCNNSYEVMLYQIPDFFTPLTAKGTTGL